MYYRVYNGHRVCLCPIYMVPSFDPENGVSYVLVKIYFDNSDSVDLEVPSYERILTKQ